MEIALVILLPFFGTLLGSACVFFMKGKMKENLNKLLSGFAGGVMLAASIWSLIIPSIDYSSHMDKLAFLPACIGFIVGILFLLFLDNIIPHLHKMEGVEEGPKSKLKKTTLFTFAVALHNLPEGMAVGVVLSGFLAGSVQITFIGALTLAIGIAVQNFPEGAIISMPLHSDGMKKGKAFGLGALSGVVEPIGAGLTMLLAHLVLPILPYILSFSAGAMIYVVVEDLIPSMSKDSHSNFATLAFAIGFVLMMILDVALA